MNLLRRFLPRPVENVDCFEARMTTALAAAEQGDYATALAIWEPLAQAGNARAQNNIGACFAGGLGVARNTGLARRWLELSAEAGDRVGQRNLASLLFKQGCPGKVPGESKCRRRMPRQTAVFRLFSGCRDSEKGTEHALYA